MIQQVNLYQHQQGESSQLIRNPYLLTAGVVTVLLLIISLISIINLHGNRDQQQQLTKQLQQAQVQLQLLQAQYPKQQVDTVVNQQIQQAQGYYQNLSHTLGILADTQSDQFRGYSRYLTVLANQSDNNVWLTNIRFNTETNTINLEGATFKPDKVPLLLQRLQNTSVFKGRHFAKLSIQQDKDVQDQIDFSVSTSLVAEAEGNNADKH